MKSEPGTGGDAARLPGFVGIRQGWTAGPCVDHRRAADELKIENERLRFLVETLDAERLVLEARLGTLREVLRARCDEAEDLRRRLGEVVN